MLNDVDMHIVRLVRQAQQGDQDSFAALYRHYGTTVLRTAYAILGDMNLAEEVVQEVFIRIHRYLDRYQAERGVFAAWIYRITVNECLKIRQHWWRWFSLTNDESHAARSSTLESPLEAALIGEEQRRVWQAIQQLSLKLRVVVVLRYYQDMSYADIAQILECPIGTVRSRLNAAHTQLQKILKEDEQ